mmetsp:Transcript_1775/g.2972  ORF Transcript_1775/g.2972 Transcript_1775/m.2972 type:complete len:135 (+) Transcript_1775:30-434(+)
MANNSDALFGGAPAKKSSRAWGVPEETEETKGMDNNQLFGAQSQIVKKQDDHLDILAESIQRTKHIALAIDDEVTEQDKLLDSLNDHVDSTGAKLRNTTRRVKRVERKSSTKLLWLIICILFLGLVGVSVAAFQ